MKKTAIFLVLLVLLLLPQRVEVQAQPAGLPPATAARPVPAPDPLGRSTPRGTVVGLIRAAEQENLERAAEYLESGLRPADRRELARKLWVVLNRELRIDPERLSDQPDGDPDDGLVERDRIGLIEGRSGTIEILLDRVRRGQGEATWLFSSDLLVQIPRLYDELQPPWIERYVPARLGAVRWLSMPLYRWIGLLLFIPLVFGLAALCTRALDPVVRRVTRQRYGRALAGVGPMRLLVLALLFHAGSFLGLSLAARNFWQRVGETLAVIALCWLSIRIADLLTGLAVGRLRRKARSADLALVLLLNRLMKAGSVIVAALWLLYLSDVNLTAAFTGLGVGGLAIGFGAQKTIENLFGGIMVISDKPISVGDVCRAGEFFGTVEDIGIRSTRIRTLDRTVVSVPNGQLAAMSLENFALRDRVRFQHTIGLALQTTPRQLRHVLGQIRRLLETHPKVERASARTRFVRLASTSLELEVFAYVLENEQPAFLAVQEDLLLAIMDILDASGTSIAAPAAPAPAALAQRRLGGP